MRVWAINEQPSCVKVLSGPGSGLYSVDAMLMPGAAVPAAPPVAKRGLARFDTTGVRSFPAR